MALADQLPHLNAVAAERGLAESDVAQLRELILEADACVQNYETYSRQGLSEAWTWLVHAKGFVDRFGVLSAEIIEQNGGRSSAAPRPVGYARASG